MNLLFSFSHKQLVLVQRLVFTRRSFLFHYICSVHNSMSLSTLRFYAGYFIFLRFVSILKQYISNNKTQDNAFQK